MNTKEILNSAESISLENAHENHSKLCEIWPMVKQGLELLRDAIKNPIVKYTISGIIAAGEAVVGKICA